MSSTSLVSSTKQNAYSPIEPPPASGTPKAESATKPQAPAVDLEYVPSPLIASAMPKPVTGPVTSPAAVDVSAWPMPVLERNALAIRARLAKDPGSVSKDDRNLLERIEAEIRKRDEATPKLPGKLGVMRCERPADLPGNSAIGLPHRWLKTGKKEAGMGIAGGGVPGHEGGPSGYPGVKTEIVDHKGESQGIEADCVPLEGVDEKCVDEKLQIGKATGRWLPPFNDCHTTVDDVVKDCVKPGVNPYAKITTDAADAGVP